MAKTPIHKVISQVLRGATGPLTPKQIYDAIVAQALYSFKAADPIHVVKSELRRRTKELNFPSGHEDKYFTITADGKYSLLPKPIKVNLPVYKVPAGTDGMRAGTLVTVPPNDDEQVQNEVEGPSGPSHTEIQWRLLDLGSQMGLSVWAPRADRGNEWEGKRLADVPRMLDKLPVKFDVTTRKTIENIDVLWFEKSAILAGFEVEHTTTIYSGLLRMSDLLAMQPNIEIKFYIVAPDNREGKFALEVIRPTFRAVRKPLHTVCRFLPYSGLLDKLREANGLLPFLNPAFLDIIAQFHTPAAEDGD